MFTLKRTCTSCPEQYDVYHNGEEVGYLRLRHGCFTADHKGKQVYSACPDGDGSFEDYERDKFLNEACKAIKESMEVGPLLFTIESQSDYT